MAYVAHEMLLGCLAAAVGLVSGALPPTAGLVFPLLVAAAAILIGLSLHRVLRCAPGLYQVPRCSRYDKPAHSQERALNGA